MKQHRIITMPVMFQVQSMKIQDTHAHFRIFHLVDSVEFPQGLAKSKKEAKAAAARHAIACLLEINEEQLSPEYLGQNFLGKFIIIV